MAAAQGVTSKALVDYLVIVYWRKFRETIAADRKRYILNLLMRLNTDRKENITKKILYLTDCSRGQVDINNLDSRQASIIPKHVHNFGAIHIERRVELVVSTLSGKQLCRRPIRKRFDLTPKCCDQMRYKYQMYQALP